MATLLKQNLLLETDMEHQSGSACITKHMKCCRKPASTKMKVTCKDNKSKDPFSRCEICKNLDSDRVDDDMTRSDFNIRKERTLHLVSRMRGEMQLTNETILLDVEASDTNNYVKTKIQRNNTKHNMKLNSDLNT